MPQNIVLHLHRKHRKDLSFFLIYIENIEKIHQQKANFWVIKIEKSSTLLLVCGQVKEVLCRRRYSVTKDSLQERSTYRCSGELRGHILREKSSSEVGGKTYHGKQLHFSPRILLQKYGSRQKQDCMGTREETWHWGMLWFIFMYICIYILG